MKLYKHQQYAMEKTKNFSRCAYYLDMGLGKTFVGSEKMMELNNHVNLIVCQKSKITDWMNHLESNYAWKTGGQIYDLTNKYDYKEFFERLDEALPVIGVINYDVVWRRSDIAKLKDFTLMLDESSMIANERSKRTKFILKLKAKNVILLSGTPVGGKYEQLWSQSKLLGWNITKKDFWDRYVNYFEYNRSGFPIKIINGYKNVDELKDELRGHGAVFMKSTDSGIELPEQTFINVEINKPREYQILCKDKIVPLNDGVELVADSALNEQLCKRLICGVYNKDKISAFCDLINSTYDRLIVFYNFKREFDILSEICASEDRPVSVVNGTTKDLINYEKYDNSVTFIQYQSGAMGLNLQKGNKIIYYTPTRSSALFEQSKKRIHRIGQSQPCFYYQLIAKDTIEEDIYEALSKRKDYTDYLYEVKNG